MCPWRVPWGSVGKGCPRGACPQRGGGAHDGHPAGEEVPKKPWCPQPQQRGDRLVSFPCHPIRLHSCGLTQGRADTTHPALQCGRVLLLLGAQQGQDSAIRGHEVVWDAGYGHGFKLGPSCRAPCSARRRRRRVPLGVWTLLQLPRGSSPRGILGTIFIISNKNEKIVIEKSNFSKQLFFFLKST